MMSKWWCLFIGCIAWSGAYAVTLEEQYSGLHNCRFENVYYDQQLKQFGPEAYFLKRITQNLVYAGNLKVLHHFASMGN